MRILMFTNTFTPHVGWVARSLQQFTNEYRKLGHQVLVVAPVFHRSVEAQLPRLAAHDCTNGRATIASPRAESQRTKRRLQVNETARGLQFCRDEPQRLSRT